TVAGKLGVADAEARLCGGRLQRAGGKIHFTARKLHGITRREPYRAFACVQLHARRVAQYRGTAARAFENGEDVSARAFRRVENTVVLDRFDEAREGARETTHALFRAHGVAAVTV